MINLRQPPVVLRMKSFYFKRGNDERTATITPVHFPTPQKGLSAHESKNIVTLLAYSPTQLGLYDVITLTCKWHRKRRNNGS